MYIWEEEREGQLLSKFAEMKVTDVSLYQMYQSYLNEYIFKNYRLDLFKEIAIGFNHGLQMTFEYSASLSDGLKIGKCCRYPCLLFIFCVARIFLWVGIFDFRSVASHTPESRGL